MGGKTRVGIEKREGIKNLWKNNVKLLREGKQTVLIVGGHSIPVL